ncbi:MAG: ATP-binding protein [Proteobacteria bacterium]|nr:ATP-binding protein [Pseudomonadota bacterium]
MWKDENIPSVISAKAGVRIIHFKKRSTVVALSLLIFLAGLALAYWFALLHHRADVSHERTAITARLDKARGEISRQVDSIIHLSQGLVSLVKIQHGISEAQFASMAQEIVTNEPRIRNIALAPGNIIRFVYPIKGNERALGLDYLKTPDQREAVLRVIQEKTTVVAGPVNLVQGGVGIISRTPIYMRDSPASNGEPRYWGIASTVIDFDTLIRSTGLANRANQNIRFALRGKDGLGATGETFWGDNRIFTMDPVLMYITLPSGSWQIAALPAKGWPVFNPLRSLYFLFGCIISSIFSILFFQLIRINSVLRQEVRERIDAEEALRQSEEKYRSIFENSIMGIFRTTTDGHYLSVNPAGARMYGYKSQEEMMQSVTDMAHNVYVHPEDRERFKETLESNGFVEGFEAEHYTKERRKIWASMNARVIRDDSGAVLYYETTSEDITKRKLAEDELDQYRLHLEDLVRDRTQELEKAKEAAEGADRLKSAFLATMSHELRTPLNSIIGFTGIMLQGIAGPLNEEQGKQLGMVQKSSKHLLNLINDVLDISKIEAGQLELQSEPFDLRKSIENIIDIVTPLAVKKDLTLSTYIDEAINEFVGDQRRVEQALINLINNGIKFTEKGGIIISCRKDASRILIDVKDTGIGIEPEDMEKIFKPFQQTDIGIAKKQEGTGLGLSITKKLVEMMNGQIQVHSEVGMGSTFTVILNM